MSLLEPPDSLHKVETDPDHVEGKTCLAKFISSSNLRYGVISAEHYCRFSSVFLSLS